MVFFSHVTPDDDETERFLVAGRPNYDRCDNKIVTARYTVLSFLPVAIGEQFRRFANLYFLCIGAIMCLGKYTDLFATSMSPYTTVGPLAIVISVSLAVEGNADIKRHRSDAEINNGGCIILRRSADIDEEDGAERDSSIIGGKDVVVNLSKNYLTKSSSLRLPTGDAEQPMDSSPRLVQVAFQKIKRMNIRQGHIILIRNREAVPADTIILASSGENGCAYIETSSIDGETNLKLRNSPKIPSLISKDLRKEVMSNFLEDGFDEERTLQSLERATKKITQVSALAYPNGVACGIPDQDKGERRRRFSEKMGKNSRSSMNGEKPKNETTQYIATLASEAPNSHINTFSGKLTLPPFEKGEECIEIPLDAENILLRGAILRNTEWVLGLSCFTGKDTKLIRNSFRTPSKFSRIDVLINKCVVLIVAFMCTCIFYLSIKADFATKESFDELWYVGYNHKKSDTWPYLPNLPPPKWVDTSNTILQNFLMFVTLLSNFVPLSMYVTLEMVNFFCLWLVYVDPEMYDPKTDTRAVARSTNVTDLGQVQYIFSDKTGTLTQNVMRFKRCSVDGMIFGAPVQKTRPQDKNVEGSPKPAFHPTRQLVVGKIHLKADGSGVEASKGMTFNAEMFVRVMSLCHTVVVEKDLDNRDNIEESKSVSSYGSTWVRKKLFQGRRPRMASDMSTASAIALGTVSEEPVADLPLDFCDKGTSRSSLGSIVRGGSYSSGSNPTEMGRDGAPAGFAYQAESPDENALVSEASKTFGLQVIGRNSSGITLRCQHPTILSEENLVTGLRSGSINSKTLVSKYATGSVEVGKTEIRERLKYTKSSRIETWEILAVNKFDSERKRMSILLRAPPELGSVAILFCKGADSAMLDPHVCAEAANLFSGNVEDDAERSHRLEVIFDDSDDSEFDTNQMLGLQSHLGEFASEGLRTLVLGVRFLNDTECDEWLQKYGTAASSVKDRDKMLMDAALEIERDLHIVGATAVEDKLQSGVPDTIATLENAGIKLWVLTGDKKETAIEIGYSTKVLTPKMHLTEVADQGNEFVHAQCAMEFMRLVKAGKLPLYQRVTVDQSDSPWSLQNLAFAIGKTLHSCLRACRYTTLLLIICLRKAIGLSSKSQEKEIKSLRGEQKEEKGRLQDNVRRRNVRNRAEQIIQEYRQKVPKVHMKKPLSPASSVENFNLSNDNLPIVFNRAESARSALEMRVSQEGSSLSNTRSIRISQLTAQEVAENRSEASFEEDLLSLQSVRGAASDNNLSFDKKRRTVLEKLFAVDRDVRKGYLMKHLRKGGMGSDFFITPSAEGPRALIIEGNALKHLFGDNQLEEILFNIASQCDAVIACRVSPQQKALLVKLVRHHVVSQPVTLAIGDGANDVGMIQEAHVGIGISGKEGQQAVNASDFAISQFRFLETLLLVHGRWDFMRQATVVLFSFYKNAVMAGCLILYNGSTLYSGQTLFDQWMVSTFNFIVFWPIYLLGILDRCLEKDYIRKNPEVYKSTRQNEVLTTRILLRWIFMTVSHIVILYYGSFYYLSGGGGNSSAYSGLMRYYKRVGDGEGSDLQSVGLVIFSSMVILLAYKVLYESRSIINGKWPAIACWKNAREGFWSRVPYSWYGILHGSVLFHFLFFLPIYNKITKFADKYSGGFFNLNGVVPHVLRTSATNYILLLFVPIAGMAFDICWKVFSNMYYPTQTQIHIEIESKNLAEERNVNRRDKTEKRGYGVGSI
mmetsp:Transcript_24073/g.66728  ORF Transcript_24073/g.66728 Transcript_24073/m.66728 type:complete len:1719 (+) Transcript_24073:215-5371(+)